jgi:hypothetical protein
MDVVRKIRNSEKPGVSSPHVFSLPVEVWRGKNHLSSPSSLASFSRTKSAHPSTVTTLEVFWPCVMLSGGVLEAKRLLFPVNKACC